MKFEIRLEALLGVKGLKWTQWSCPVHFPKINVIYIDTLCLQRLFHFLVLGWNNHCYYIVSTSLLNSPIWCQSIYCGCMAMCHQVPE